VLQIFVSQIIVDNCRRNDCWYIYVCCRKHVFRDYCLW